MMHAPSWAARAACGALVAAAAVTATAGAVAHPAARTQERSTRVVATGLDSPRGLALTPAGKLLVAEAGHGGDVCVPAGPLGEECLGTTSQIAAVDPESGRASPLVTGLFSESVTMEGITGADGVSTFGGRTFATLAEAPQEFATLTCDRQPADCADVLAATRAQAGQLVQVAPGGTWKAVAGVGAQGYDLVAADPSLGDPRDGPHANPYGLVALSRGVWVADAGANLLDWIPNDGRLDVASHLPDPPAGGFPADAVPTCVAVLRGNLYAADLAGRVFERGGKFTPTPIPVVDASGKPLLHHVTGCVSDGLDHLYLVDMWGTPGPPIPAGPGSAAGTGSVVELTRNGAATVLASGLDFPNGIALAKDGSLYVSVGSTCTATGTPFPYCAKGGQIVELKP